MKGRLIDTQIDRQVDRYIDRYIDIYIDRQREKQIDTQIDSYRKADKGKGTGMQMKEKHMKIFRDAASYHIQFDFIRLGEGVLSLSK